MNTPALSPSDARAVVAAYITARRRGLNDGQSRDFAASLVAYTGYLARRRIDRAAIEAAIDAGTAAVLI